MDKCDDISQLIANCPRRKESVREREKERERERKREKEKDCNTRSTSNLKYVTFEAVLCTQCKFAISKCVCVCEREREMERERHTQTHIAKKI